MLDLRRQLDWIASHRGDPRALAVVASCIECVSRRLDDDDLVVQAVTHRLTRPSRGDLAAWHRGLIAAAERAAGRSLADTLLDTQDMALLQRALRDVPPLLPADGPDHRARLARMRAALRRAGVDQPGAPPSP